MITNFLLYSQVCTLIHEVYRSCLRLYKKITNEQATEIVAHTIPSSICQMTDYFKIQVSISIHDYIRM